MIDIPNGLATLWVAMKMLCRAKQKVNIPSILEWFPENVRGNITITLDSVCAIVEAVQALDSFPFAYDAEPGGFEDAA